MHGFGLCGSSAEEEKEMREINGELGMHGALGKYTERKRARTRVERKELEIVCTPIKGQAFELQRKKNLHTELIATLSKFKFLTKEIFVFFWDDG